MIDLPFADAATQREIIEIIEITLRHGCSPVNLLHIFRTVFPKNTSEWLLIFYVYVLGHMHTTSKSNSSKILVFEIAS